VYAATPHTIESVRALLISTYDLGRQPLGLARPASLLRQAGIEVRCVDVSREPLHDADIAAAALVAFYLPMHTATRLAAPIIDRVRRENPAARLAAYGLYAPLNADWLRQRGVADVLGPQEEGKLTQSARQAGSHREASSPPAGAPDGRALPVRPDRDTLPPLSRYAVLQMPDGSRKVVGSTDATHGCKHLCRHCPIVPVYGGVFRAFPLDIVMDDVRALVAGGARHITFGDPDFLNGPTHARRLVEQLHRECPQITYDCTIKVEHLLRHAHMVTLLRDTGCLFITSAVESVDDEVLTKLRKGHTRADFARVVALCRDADVALVPTFVPFTPWTTLAGYVDLLDQIDALDIVEHVAPVQLGIRLLVTARSSLLELDEIRAAVEPFDGGSLTWPWRHVDPRVDLLQRDVMALAAAGASGSRGDVFTAIRARAGSDAGLPPPRARARRSGGVPMLTDAWYCCAEPLEQQL
jgi:hypothetical protein